MEKFTKLSVNGVIKQVAAVYDGSDNDIVATYETKTDATTKETTLGGRITTVSEALEALTERVVATEGFNTAIQQNTENIKTNTDDIANLKLADTATTEALNALTIKVGENTTNVSTVSTSLGSLSLTVLGNSNKIGNIEAIINDEAQGITALNNQVDDLLRRIAILEGTPE
jgi:chromosome segregation ATPase